MPVTRPSLTDSYACDTNNSPRGSMHFIRRFRIPALFCALSVLVCELISRPFADMGICDDGPYILVAQKLATSGHIVYNGWSAAMLAWQLYLGAAFIKLFGFSFTTVRMSTLLVAVVLAFVLQRTLVLAGITERNATIGTLALVLSPLSLILSVTFMSDIHGLFAIVLCLYGCLRALRSETDRGAILWLCFAVAANAICGTSRQLAWTGVLVMVPSTLWLLRARRRVLLAGAAVNLAGVLFILGCMVWLKHQPYTTPERFAFSFSDIPYRHLVLQFARFFLDFPFLLLPITASFLFAIRGSRPRTIALVCGSLAVFIFLAIYPSPLRDHFDSLLEPTIGDWVNVTGGYVPFSPGGPTFVSRGMQILLTVVSLSGLISLFVSFFHRGHNQLVIDASPAVSWKQLAFVLTPFASAYIFLLLYRAATAAHDGTGMIFDRYSLGLLLVALVFLVRYFQDRVQPRIPSASVLLVIAMATFGVALTHNTFALYRARATVAAELRAAGLPDTSVDNGWEYNINVEIKQTGHVNNPFILSPAEAYIPTTPPPAGPCQLFWYDFTAHIHPLFSVSFDPNACYGLAPFAPVHYSRWLAGSAGTLYVVRYTPTVKP